MTKNTIYVFKTIERNRNRIDYSFYDTYEEAIEDCIKWLNEDWEENL